MTESTLRRDVEIAIFCVHLRNSFTRVEILFYSEGEQWLKSKHIVINSKLPRLIYNQHITKSINTRSDSITCPANQNISTP